MELKKTLLEFSKVTHGRLARTRVFSDYLAYCALLLSSRTDPVHRKKRLEQFKKLQEPYSDSEWQMFQQTIAEMCSVVIRNTEMGYFHDLFGETYMELGGRNTALKQDFTTNDVARLISMLTIRDDTELPECGYFSVSDHTCGSGALLLSCAERLQQIGFNPSAHLVVQAADLDIQCVYMTYINLSLYGIPAVIIHGDTIKLEEYDRWYTPVYLLDRWIWKEPMPFGDGGYASNEILKTVDEPMYGVWRQVERLLSPHQEKETSD